MKHTALRRGILGALLGAVLAVAGPLGMAVGWLSHPLPIYEDEIRFGAGVGVFAYTEGRIEAKLEWSRYDTVTVCDEGGGCYEEDVNEQLVLFVAEGRGPAASQWTERFGHVPVNDPANSSTEGANWGDTRVGPYRAANAFYSYCGPDACFDRAAWYEGDDFSFTVDPLLRTATFQGVLQAESEYGQAPVAFSVSWDAAGAPLGNGAEPNASHTTDPGVNHSSRSHVDLTLRRSAAVTWDLAGFAPPPPPGEKGWGAIMYGAAAGHSGGATARQNQPTPVPLP